MIDQDRLYVVSEVASLLRCHPETIRRRIRAEEIKGVIILGNQYLIPGKALQEYLDEHSPEKYANKYA